MLRGVAFAAVLAIPAFAQSDSSWSSVTDAEYDRLMQELIMLENEHPEFQSPLPLKRQKS